jgi:hypothetical protein
MFFGDFLLIQTTIPVIPYHPQKSRASLTTWRMTLETTSACSAAKMPRKFQEMFGGDIMVI